MNRPQEIRHECLLQVYGSQAIPISVAHVRRVCKRNGFDYSDSEIENALFFLVGQGFAERLPDPATGEVKYRVTSKGMLHWEASG